MSNSTSKGKSGNTGGGTETSFVNTPQAKDDPFGSAGSGQLDYVSTVYVLDVMQNDLGGNAKSLWSVDDGVNNSGAMSGHEAGDLLTQDLAGVTGVAANRSKFGAALSVTADGRVAYDTSTIDAQYALDLTTLALGEVMTDSFIYAIRLASGTLSWARANVVLTGVNDTPVVQDVTLLAVEDGVAVSGAFNGDDIDSDDDGSTLVYTINGAPALGTLTNNGDGTFTYDPGTNFQSLAEGEEAEIDLSYTATDSHGAVSVPGALKITVTGVNDVPTLLAGALGATEDGAIVTLDLSALGDDIDSDDNGSSLTYTLESVPPGGSASISGTVLSFNPGADFQNLAVGEPLSFDLQVRATDNKGASVTNTVSITLTGVNDAAVVQDVAVAATEDGVAVTGAFIGDDVDSDDDGASLVYTINGAPANGSLTNNGDGTFTFAPGADFQSLAAGEATEIDLSYTATDSHGLVSAAADLTVTVTGVNDAPTLAGSAVGATEDGPAVSVNLAALGNDIDSDDDGSTLTYSLLNAPASGSAEVSGTTLSFNPGSDFQALAQGQTTSFDLLVRATDAHGASADNKVKITVTGANDAPVIQNGSDGVGAVTGKAPVAPFTVQQYSGYRSTNLSELESYAASNAASLTVTTSVIDYTDDPAGFAGEIPGSNPWPVAQANGATGTSHSLNDNFFVRITGQVNVTTADTYTFRTFNDDGVFLKVNNSLIINDPGIHPENAREGSIFLTPGTYPIELFFFEFGGEASLEFTYRNSTGNYGLVDLDPLLRDSGIVLFNDVDLTDTHVVSAAPDGAMLGSLTASMISDTNGTGVGGQVKWQYAVDNEAVRYLGAGDTKVESFTITVDDGNGGTDTQQVDVTVTGINDVAVLGNAVANLIETDVQLSTGGTLSIADVDSGEAFFNAQSNVAGVHGSFSIDANGVWNYNSNGALDHLVAGQVVTDVFNVTSVDGTATTVTVSVTGTADGPVAFNDSSALTASSAPSGADKTVYWVDWTGLTLESAALGRNGVYSVAGTITMPTGTIGVTYRGQLEGSQLSGGTDFYVTKNGGYGGPVSSTDGAGVYTSADVANGPTNNDILRLNHADSARTLTFSEPVANLFFAVVSMNANGYLFDQDFKVVSSADSSSDSGYWGWADSYTKTNLGDGRYGIATPTTGNNEFHGVLAIENAVSSLTWTGQSHENWNGFTIGTYGKAQTATVSGNVLSNDDKGGPTATIEVSAVGGVNMVGNSVTLTLASGAILKVDRDGDYFYDDKGKFTSLGAGDSHQEVVQYTVRDNDGYTDTATLTITVNGVNDGPLAVADAATTNEDSAVTINVLANDTDPDNGDAKVLLGVTQGQKGTVSVSGNNVIYTPNANVNGNDTFSYTVRDTAGATSTAAVTVTINPVTDTYVISNLVNNGSFESGVTGWSQFGGGVDVVGDWQAVDGTRVIDLNAFTRGELSQQLSTTPGQSYTLGFNLSQNPGASSSTVQVAAGTVSQAFSFSQDSTTADMKWEFKTLSFTADSNSSLLSFYSLTPSTPQGFPDDAEGPAIDEVVVLANRVLSDFDVGGGGDVLNLSGLMTSISAPHDSSAFSGGFVRFQNSGSDTVVQIDADGGGNEYMTAVTLIGVNLTQADTGNYIL